MSSRAHYALVPARGREMPDRFTRQCHTHTRVTRADSTTASDRLAGNNDQKHLTQTMFTGKHLVHDVKPLAHVK